MYAGLGLKGHNGIDFAVFNGTSILAAHDGTVTQVFDNIGSTFSRGYGVYVTHPEGWFTVYWHSLVPKVKVGDVVRTGDFLTYSDNSGQTTGPHLHFGLYDYPRDMTNGYDGAIDPLPYLQIGLLTQIKDLLIKVVALLIKK
jgi:murein DD-endopeptidase MepM/ murein hydrolase activator NlpD